jgi:hypothetical protein
MAQKESSHKEVVEKLNSQLSQVQRQLDDLTTLSRDQVCGSICFQSLIEYDNLIQGIKYVY